MNPRVLLLIGSARKPHSSSESLGTYLLDCLRARGMETEKLLLHESLWTDEPRRALLDTVDRADILALAFPLYVDTLPFIVTRALELIAEHRHQNGKPKQQRLLCIVNCGFPESQHCNTAVAVCRQFARETDFAWVGGLGLGGGGAINGRPLEQLGGMIRHAIKALNLTADALVANQPIPQEAIALMAKSFIPTWLYVLIAGSSWKKVAKPFGVEKRLRERPYMK
jgi:hypothetical protein